MQSVAYDEVAAWVDTDTDWTSVAEKWAKKYKIQVVTSEPCLEALLLRTMGKVPSANKSFKAQFAPFVNDDATARENYAAHFSVSVLQSSRPRESSIDSLLKLFRL